MCDDYSDGRSEPLFEGWRRARKEHRCFACREAIRAGDRYHSQVDVYEGELSNCRHCARCWRMIEALWAAGAEWVDYGLDCGESWEQNYGPVPDEVARLAFLTPDEAQALA